jgi:DNA-binding NarL/FixJ family response regulator
VLKILVADDSEVVRRLLKTALSGERGWSLCGEACDGQQAVRLARELKPDLIIMDLAMPLLDGLHASAEILKFAAALPIVLYTLHNTPQIALEAKKAGIKAVVSKTGDIKVLVETIERMASEMAEVSPLATISNELFTAVPATTEELPVENVAAAPEPTARGAASGAASLPTPAPISVESSGDTATKEAEPPSQKISEPPPGVA